MLPSECIDLPGGELINAEPERLQGPWGLPARIWLQGKPLDSVAWPDASSDQRTAPHVLSHPLGRATNNTLLPACLKISQAYQSKLRELVQRPIVRQPHKHIDHTLSIEKRAGFSLVSLQRIPALLQRFHVNESTWKLASHLNAIFEHCEAYLPKDEAMARSDNSHPNDASQQRIQQRGADKVQAQTQLLAHESAALLALATEYIAVFLDVALQNCLRSIAGESMAAHAPVLHQFGERHTLAELITTQHQHIERLDGVVVQLRADLDHVLAALEATLQRPTAPYPKTKRRQA